MRERSWHIIFCFLGTIILRVLCFFFVARDGDTWLSKNTFSLSEFSECSTRENLFLKFRHRDQAVDSCSSSTHGIFLYLEIALSGWGRYAFVICLQFFFRLCLLFFESHSSLLFLHHCDSFKFSEFSISSDPKVLDWWSGGSWGLRFWIWDSGMAVGIGGTKGDDPVAKTR